MLQKRCAQTSFHKPANAHTQLGFASGQPGKAKPFTSHGGPKDRTEQESKRTGPQEPQSSSLCWAIQLAKQGDATAFEHIYRLHSRRVYSLCLRIARDPVEAEDLTQEAFLQLFRKIHTFRGESAFSSWLHRLTANVVLMRLRKKKLPTDSLDSPIESDDESCSTGHEIGVVDLGLKGLLDRINLQAAIDQLPEGYKAMFLLHDVEGYDHNEIARMRGCSVGNSKSQLHKARKQLRAELCGRGVSCD
jgi:RNA polymerase sigma-70 factor (ECF subfamily)